MSDSDSDHDSDASSESEPDYDTPPRDYAYFDKHYYEYERKVESMESEIARAESQLMGLRHKYDTMMATINVYNGRKIRTAGYLIYKFSRAFHYKFNVVIGGLLKGHTVFIKGEFKFEVPAQLKYPKRIYLGVVEVLDKFVWHRVIENKDGDHAIGRRVLSFTI